MSVLERSLSEAGQTPEAPPTPGGAGLVHAGRRSRVRRLRGMGLAGVGALLLLLVAVVAVVAPWISPYDPAAVTLVDRLQPPLSPGHLLGTDALGQDVLSRVIYGARVSMLVGFLAVVISGGLGVTLGLLAGYYGKWLDSLIMRVGDIQLAYPTIILYVAVMAVLGPGVLKLIAVIGVVSWVPFGRVERGLVLSVRQQEYVEAARAMGASDWRLLRRHILPNTVGPIIVIASFGVANAILLEASLSFLGLGVPPSVPSWGSMLADGRDYLRAGWWITTFPGIAITLTVLAVNLLGDWLRDELDPVLRARRHAGKTSGGRRP